MKNKKVISLILILVVLSIAFLGLKSKAEEPTDKEQVEKVYTVEIINAEVVGNKAYFSYAGLIQPAKMTQVAFEHIAEIKEIYVDVGDYVTKGQALVKIDASNIQDQKNVAQQSLDSTEKAKNSTKESLDNAQTNYNEVNEVDISKDLEELQKEIYEETVKRDKLQKELDDITNICKTEQSIVDEKQEKLNKLNDELPKLEQDIVDKTTQRDTVQKELDELNSAEDKNQEAIDKKQQELDTINAELDVLKEKKDTEIPKANEELTQAKANLAKKEIEYNKADKQAEVNASQIIIDAKQSEYDTKESTDKANKDLAKERLDTAQTAYDQAVSSYDQAKIICENLDEDITQTVYYAKNNGFVVKIVGEEGQMSTPIMPIMVIGEEGMLAQFGVSQDDAQNVTVGLKCELEINNITYTGSVTNVEVVPDSQTRTYLTDVKIDGNTDDLFIGQTANVKILKAESLGVWIPLNIILNNGDNDYIYVVENDRAVAKNIVIEELDNDKVRISGINNNEKIIIKGMKTVNQGSKVVVIE